MVRMPDAHALSWAPRVGRVGAATAHNELNFRSLPALCDLDLHASARDCHVLTDPRLCAEPPPEPHAEQQPCGPPCASWEARVRNVDESHDGAGLRAALPHAGG